MPAVSDSESHVDAPRRTQFAPWPEVLAVLAATLVYLFARGGLVAPGPTAVIVVGALAGIAASLPASSALRGSMAAGAAVLVGWLVAPVFGMEMLPWALVTGAFAAIVALGARWLVDEGHMRASLLVVIGIVVVAGSFWFSTMLLARDQVVVEDKTLFEFLVAAPQADVDQPDQMFYSAVLHKMRAGTGFYDAYREAFHENALWRGDPPTIIAVREPLLPVALSRLPGDGRSPIWAMALAASAMIVSAISLPRNLAHPTVRLISVIAVAAYVLAFTTTPLAIGFEPWGAVVGTLAASLFALSLDQEMSPRRRRTIVICAALLAILAVAIREIMVFLPVAGLIGALFADRDRRRFDTLAWGTALAGGLLAWGLHAYAAGRIVTPSDILGTAWVFGGFGNVIAAVKYAAFYVTTYRPLLAVLTALGILGAALQESRQYRVFMLLCLLLPLVTFFFAWNEAIDNATGAQVNYWGIVMGPLLFAMIPAALGIVPGASRSRSRDVAAEGAS